MKEDCSCNKKPYTVEHILDVDIDELGTPVDYFIGVRTVEDPSTGAVVASPVRVPGEKVLPTGSMQNVVALDTNNAALEVPTGQVLGGYYDVQPGGNVMRLAGNGHQAQFLMVANYTGQRMLVQTTGFLDIKAGHQYVVGLQYYLGADGQPVTDSSVTGQKLFVPLNDHILNINGDF